MHRYKERERERENENESERRKERGREEKMKRRKLNKKSAFIQKQLRKEKCVRVRENAANA